MSSTGRVFAGPAPGIYVIYLKGLDEQGMIEQLEPFGCEPVRGARGQLLGFTNPRNHELHFGSDLPDASKAINSMIVSATFTAPKPGECPCGGSWGVCEYHR
jgi:hypothetical protein